jgi:hypothetical protein
VPVEKNISHYRGDDWELPMRLRGRAPDGTLLDYIDLTGYTSKAQLRLTDDATVVAAEITCVIANPQTGADKGKITLSLTHAQTEVLAGEFQWDWQMTNPAGKVKTYFTGTFSFERDTTRA